MPTSDQRDQERRLNVGLFVAATSLGIAIIGLPVLRANLNRARSERTVAQFRTAFDHVRTGHQKVNSVVLQEMASQREGAAGVLAKPGWIPDRLIRLEDVRLTMDDSVDTDDQILATRQRARDLMPRRVDGRAYASYSQLLTELGNMNHLYNGAIYRPVGIESVNGRLEVSLTMGWYFDHLDTTNVLSYETALRYTSHKKKVLDGRYRRYIGSPFDLDRRVTSLGVNTLTVRRGENGYGFYLHRRDRDWVTEGAETIHVIPAGEFTPSDLSLQAQLDDLNLWHNIMREYAEEFLDMEEAYGLGGGSIDYVHRSPFKDLDAARTCGDLAVHVLGIAVDPVDWKPEFLTVCVFEGHVFDDIFHNMVSKGREGTILTGPNGKGMAFDHDTVQLYVTNSNVTNAATTSLQLAWKHRVALGIADT